MPKYELVLIDEFQDFNEVEAGVIELLAERSPITIAGDDDQALYSQLRGANWAHIRKHHRAGEYEVFELPFCMRCPEVIVGAINDIIGAAQAVKKLVGRIPKPFRFYEPVKGEDSKRFPHIEVARTTVQSNKANYFGKYLEEQIRAIPADELKSASEKHEPAALIIGSKPYLPMVGAHLIQCGLLTPEPDDKMSEKERALEMLHHDPSSNLAWRILLAQLPVGEVRPIVQAAHANETKLVEETAGEFRLAILAEAAAFAAAQAAKPEAEEKANNTPAVKLTSFEGSKGLSAQYVFLVGVHDGELPRKDPPEDIEICKFLVGLTRTKKKCSILIAKNFAGTFKKPSVFFRWIKKDRFELVEVSAGYWKKG